MQTCQTIREKLPLYAYDELDAAEQAAVEAHLAACPECRRELESISAMLEKTPALTAREEPLQNFRRALFYRLREQAAPKSERRPHWALQFAVVTAVFVIGLFGGKALWQPEASMPGTQPQPVVVGDRNGFIDVQQIEIDPATRQVEIQVRAVKHQTLRGGLDEPHIQQALAAALVKPEHAGERYRAMKALHLADGGAALADKTVQAIQQVLATETNLGIRRLAIQVLGEQPLTPQTQNVLIYHMLNDTSLAMRMEALQALGSAKPDSAQIEALRQVAQTDSNAYMQLTSQKILGRVSNQSNNKGQEL